MPRVFISYSHDSQKLEEKVKSLSDTLIEYGVQTEIDQYTTNPAQGWPQYMLENILKSDYILCVCTENYKKRFENEEKIGVGLGAKFEGKYIQQILYNEGYNSKVLPILFADNQPIPTALQPYTHYKLYQNGEFEKLYRYITGQPLINKPQLGSIVSLDGNNVSMLSDIAFGNNNNNLNKDKDKENTVLVKNTEEIQESTDIDQFSYSTPFFDYRMGKAFPGIRGGKWFTNPEEIINRLKILLKEPLNKKGMTNPIWWFRGTSCLDINKFEVINTEKCIIECKECAVDKIYVYRSSDYYRSFIYVELKPENPVGVYENSEENIKLQMDYYGYANEEYAIYNNHPITRSEYDDGAGVINGECVDFDMNAKIRIRYLTKYNFIICAKFNPINSNEGDSTTKKILNYLLKDECNIEDLVNAIENLPRNRSDY